MDTLVKWQEFYQNLLYQWSTVETKNHEYIEDIWGFLVKFEIYFIEWTPSVIILRVAQPQVKILPMVFTR